MRPMETPLEILKFFVDPVVELAKKILKAPARIRRERLAAYVDDGADLIGQMDPFERAAIGIGGRYMGQVLNCALNADGTPAMKDPTSAFALLKCYQGLPHRKAVNFGHDMNGEPGV